jgi:hypothetical protein
MSDSQNSKMAVGFPVTGILSYNVQYTNSPLLMYKNESVIVVRRSLTLSISNYKLHTCCQVSVQAASVICF